jgi:hypothetical protein
VATAIFGFAGVVLGGLLTAGTTYYFSWSASRIEKKKAVRLVTNEIDGDIIRLLRILDMGHMPEDREKYEAFKQDLPKLLASIEWEACKDVLAQTADDRTWRDVAAFYSVIGAVFPPEQVESLRQFARVAHALVVRLGGRSAIDPSTLPEDPLKVVGLGSRS